MKLLAIHFFCAIIVIGLGSCSHNQNNSINATYDFLTKLDSYIEYVDSIKDYNDNFDFIYVEAKINDDTTKILISLWGGAYIFLNERDKIKDFIKYQNHNILLIGDFPNSIVNVEFNKTLNIIDDIVKKYYKIEFDRYPENPSFVAPLIYDYMDLTLIFKDNKLISARKQYY